VQCRVVARNIAGDGACSDNEYHHLSPSLSSLSSLSCLLLRRESLFEDLLKETDDVAAKRLACQEMRDLLMAAMEIVNEVSS
jgi:hypothetical protein